MPIQMDDKYPILIEGFLKAMQEIGFYGLERHGSRTFEAQLAAGNELVRSHRTETSVLFDHAEAHMDAYGTREPHDYFGTQRHQLAAAAFNLMMEYAYAGLDSEEEHPDGIS
jgi:hypothetical protein